MDLVEEVVRGIVQQCTKAGVPVSETLAAFVARMVRLAAWVHVLAGFSRCGGRTGDLAAPSCRGHHGASNDVSEASSCGELQRVVVLHSDFSSRFSPVLLVFKLSPSCTPSVTISTCTTHIRHHTSSPLQKISFKIAPKHRLSRPPFLTSPCPFCPFCPCSSSDRLR